MADHPGTRVVEAGERTAVHSVAAAPATMHPLVLRRQGGLDRCLVRTGTTGRHDDFGNTFSERFTAGIGTGYDCVNVQLTGWDLSYLRGDHHIEAAGVRISDVRYDRSRGTVSFLVSGRYRDDNGDDDFRWEVWYTILAFG